jgi:hypothetical protein
LVKRHATAKIFSGIATMNMKTKLAAVSVATGLALFTLGPAATAAPRPGDADFCPTVLQGVRAIVDDFGLATMRSMIGANTSPRIAAFLLDEYFRPLFSLSLGEIPVDQQDLWSKSMRNCRATDAYKAVEITYSGMAETLASMMSFVFRETNIPPYRHYLAAVDAYGKATAYLKDDLAIIEPSMDGYIAGQKLEVQLRKELAIVRPSRLAAVIERVSQKRLLALEAAIAAQEQRLATLETSMKGLSAAMQQPRLPRLPTTASIPAAEQALLGRLETMRADKAESMVMALLGGAADDEQKLVLTREMFALTPEHLDKVRFKILQKRQAAFEGFVTAANKELASATSQDMINSLTSRINKALDRRLEGRLPAAGRLIAAIETKARELREIAYRQACTDYVTKLGIGKTLHTTKVIGSRGPVELQQAMCGMRDRGVKVATFSEPGFFSSIYVLKATSAAGDFITVKMKQAETGAGTKALVGVDLTNAVETRPFTMESWKTFMAEISGF